MAGLQILKAKRNLNNYLPFMKKLLPLFNWLMIMKSLHAQNTWTVKADFRGGERQNAVGFDKSIQVDWTVVNQSNIPKYEVERSSDAINFINAGEVLQREAAAQKTIIG
jgi:hypothetical protein